LFEIGDVATKDKEEVHLGIGSLPASQKGWNAENIVSEAFRAIEEELGIQLKEDFRNNVGEVSLSNIASETPSFEYDRLETEPRSYKPFSMYPFVTRDIALWVPDGVSSEEVEALIASEASALLVKSTLFDSFTKDERTSYAFRLVFQSHDKTLTDSEVNELMERIYTHLKEKRGFEIR
jgi:phenylalanyl-tRNA synthetase beta subunit